MSTQQVIHVITKKGCIFLNPRSSIILATYINNPEPSSRHRYTFDTCYSKSMQFIPSTWSIIATFCTEPSTHIFTADPKAVELTPADFYNTFPFFKPALARCIEYPSAARIPIRAELLSPCINDTAEFFTLVVSAPEYTLYLSSRALVVTTTDNQRVLYCRVRANHDMTYPIALDYIAKTPFVITNVVVDSLFDILLQYPVGVSVQSSAQSTVAEFIAKHTEMAFP